MLLFKLCLDAQVLKRSSTRTRALEHSSTQRKFQECELARLYIWHMVYEGLQAAASRQGTVTGTLGKRFVFRYMVFLLVVEIV